MVGIYGVMSNAVTRRWAELGIRMAMGARPRDIVALVLEQASRPMIFGIAIGAAASLGFATLAASLVYGMAPNDPTTFVAVGAILLTTGLVACFLPARRATRLDPKDVLQSR
jgi:putative ABC transport system permease protein